MSFFFFFCNSVNCVLVYFRLKIRCESNESSYFESHRGAPSLFSLLNGSHDPKQRVSINKMQNDTMHLDKKQRAGTT